MRLLPRSLVGWAAAQLFPKFPQTLHLIEEYPAPQIMRLSDLQSFYGVSILRGIFYPLITNEFITIGF